MHEWEELTEWMECLAKIDWEEFDMNKPFSIAHYIKIVQYLSLCLYPKKASHEFEYYVDENGGLSTGNYFIEEYEDIMEEFSALGSNLCLFLMSYYEGSPYWETSYVELLREDYEFDKENKVTQLLEKYRSCFEDKLMDSLEEATIKQHPLYGFYELFEDGDNGAVDGGILLSSKLLPFYKKKEGRLKRKYPRICEWIRKGESILECWTSGQSVKICEPDLEKAYFFCSDASSDYFIYGYEAGILSSDVRILIAGELIDAAIFKLDDKEKFLPRELAEERRLENDIGGRSKKPYCKWDV